MSEKKIEDNPELDPRMPVPFQNKRNKKVSKFYKDIAKDYAQHATALKALKTEHADLELIREVLMEANLSDKLGTDYSAFGDAVLQGARGVETATLEIKQHLADLRTKYDALRINLTHKYKQPFPTLDETAKEGEASSGDDESKKGDAVAKGNSSDDSPKRSALRTWTDSTGKHKVEARFRGMEDGKAKLEKSDGTVLRIAPAKSERRGSPPHWGGRIESAERSDCSGSSSGGSPAGSGASGVSFIARTIAI